MRMKLECALVYCCFFVFSDITYSLVLFHRWHPPTIDVNGNGGENVATLPPLTTIWDCEKNQEGYGEEWVILEVSSLQLVSIQWPKYNKGPSSCPKGLRA